MAEATPTTRVVRFGTFEVDLRAGELRKNGLRVKLQEQPFQILAMLLMRPGEVVTREELREKLWPGDTFVDFDNSLNAAINKLREALGDAADNPRFVETLPRRGYRFIAPVDVDAGKVTGQAALPSSPPEPAPPPQAWWHASFPLWALVPVFLIVTAVALWALWQARRPKAEPTMRLSVEVTQGESLWTVQGPAAVLSPDGTRLAFVTRDAEGQRKLYLRSLDQLQATALSGTEGAANPFFSPDGEWIAFFAGGKLKKVSVATGATVTLCDAFSGRGGSWSEDGAIIFTPTPGSGLSRVSSAGGTPKAVTTLDKEKGERSHRWPQVLPGGKAVLFTVRMTRLEDRYLDVYSLDTGGRKTVQQGGFYGRYLPTGHLVFVREGTLFAASFDLRRLEVTGPPAPLLKHVVTNAGYAAGQFDFSRTGTLVYVPGGGTAKEVSIFWMDQKGKTEPLLSVPRDYLDLRFSPDGKRLAVAIEDHGNRDIWIYEWERDILSRLTFDAGRERMPLWTPDGKRVTFASDRDGARNIYWKRADGTGEVERLTESKYSQNPNSWSPDGRTLVFVETCPESSTDLWTLPVVEDGAGGLKPGKPVPFLGTTFAENAGSLSPDGRWLAYSSTESGRYEVYVRPFPGPGGKWQISTGGGDFSIWSANGRELFYRTLDVPNRFMVVSYSAEGDSFRAGNRRLWSEGEFTGRGEGWGFALHPDGKRFAVLKAAEEQEEAALDHLTLVTNWFDEVRRRVAAAGQN